MNRVRRWHFPDGTYADQPEEDFYAALAAEHKALADAVVAADKERFGPARWIRSLIAPPPGRALAYVDFSTQELAIAACLSGDDGLWHDYQDDPYLGFGRRAGLVPATATRASHATDRERFKAVVLGMNYGMTEFGLALRLSVPLEEARHLLRAHRRAYRTFWAWSDAFVDAAQLGGRASSVFGWPLAIRAGDNPRTLRNFPMQANGAEMLRLARIFATEAGLTICAPVHDALLLEADADMIEDAVTELQEHMGRASELVLGAGRRCRSDTKLVLSGERYSDERGAAMFARVLKLLAQLRDRGQPVDGSTTDMRQADGVRTLPVHFGPGMRPLPVHFGPVEYAPLFSSISSNM